MHQMPLLDADGYLAPNTAAKRHTNRTGGLLVMRTPNPVFRAAVMLQQRLLFDCCVVLKDQCTVELVR